MNIYGNSVGHPLPDPRKGMEMTGPINMNGNRIEGLGNPVDDQDAVPLKVANDLIGTAVGTAKNELSRKLCVPNLLVNSDFANPVDLMKNGYVTTKGSYPINGWQYSYDGDTARGGAGYDATHKYLYLVNNASATGNAMLYHKIPADKLKTGKYTIAFHQAGTFVKFAMLAYANGGIVKSVTSAPVNGVSLMTFELTQIQTELTIYIYAGPGKTICMDWAALYEGEYTAETLPEYQPKGYANELLACNVSDSGNVSGIKLLWKNASPASAFAAQTISLDLSGYDSVFISCFASNYSGGTDKESHFAIKGEKTTLHSQGSVLANRDVTVSATGLTFTDGVQRPTYGSWTGNTDNHGIVPDKIYGIKGVSA